MKQINLIPHKAKARAINRRLITGMVVGVLAGLVSSGSLWLVVKGQAAATEEGLATLRSNQESQQTFQNKEKEKPEDILMVQRVKQLNTLSVTEVSWRKAFSLVGAVIPQDIQLTGYGYTTAAGKISLQLSGQAPSNLSFAVFVQSLQSNPNFTSPKVTGYTYSPSTGKVVFVIAGTVPNAAVGFQSK